VFQLEIDGNLIHHCLKNVFAEALVTVAATQGLGGISLGICDEVYIVNNRIEHCGTSHLDPVVGIFVKLVDHIEVRDNSVVDNGPFRENARAAPRIGMRGGIVMSAVAMTARSASGNVLPGPDQPAARIERNVVRQPMGLALVVSALGPVAAEGNFFSSELRGPLPLEAMAGTVLILNLASREWAAQRAGERSPVFTLNAAPKRQTPDGKTLYTNNQARLGLRGSSLTCQLIATGGDLGYDSNQSDYLGLGTVVGHQLSFFVNTLLLADSVRASDSRFKEGSVLRRSSVASLISHSQAMNITSQNQGDHCIFATSVGLPSINTPNQVMDTTLCQDLNEKNRAIFNRTVLWRF
jgi:hypothetical protein